MTATPATQPADVPVRQTQQLLSRHKCGFCMTNHHQHCPGATRNGNGLVLTCPCGCRELFCRECKNTNADEIDPARWRCRDWSLCETRRPQPPTPAKKWEKRMTEKKADQPKPRCECGCGSETKGGKFRPGHDAKLKSELSRTYTQSDDRAAIALAKAEAYARGWYKGVAGLNGEVEVPEAVAELVERYGGREPLIDKCVAARYAKQK